MSDDGYVIGVAGSGDLTGGNPEHNEEVFMVKSDGTGVVQITDATEGSSVGPMLTADGAVILFRSNADLVGENPDRNWELCMALPQFVRGDANHDDRITVADAICVATYIYRGGPCDCEDGADVNDDGRVSVADAIYLVSYIYRSGFAPPDPFPECGIDATKDNLSCNFHSCVGTE
jgi:hypothetical protein